MISWWDQIRIRSKCSTWKYCGVKRDQRQTIRWRRRTNCIKRSAWSCIRRTAKRNQDNIRRPDKWKQGRKHSSVQVAFIALSSFGSNAIRGRKSISRFINYSTRNALSISSQTKSNHGGARQKSLWIIINHNQTKSNEKATSLHDHKKATQWDSPFSSTYWP